jgi:hypothetical protein
MKKSILAIAIAAIFASCSNNKPADQTTTATPAVNTQDTIGLSDYKEWKEKQELQSTQQTYTSPGVTEITPPAEEKPAKPIVIYRDAPVRQSRIAKTSKPAKNPVYKAPAEETEKPGIAKSPSPESSGAKREPYGRSTGSGTGTGTEASTGGETGTSNEEDKTVASSPTEVPAKKEGGWSKTAKGTAIGGASGAVIGAIFSKNKAKGAVIGGVVGAAGGYIFGRNKEKKEAKN